MHGTTVKKKENKINIAPFVINVLTVILNNLFRFSHIKALFLISIEVSQFLSTLVPSSHRSRLAELLNCVEQTQ